MDQLDVRLYERNKRSTASWVVLTIGLFFLTIGVVPSLIETWQRVPAPLPIVIHGQRITWVGPRAFQTTSDRVEWTDTCPRATISRYLVLKNGENVPVSGRVLSGPLKGIAQEPRYDLALTPQERQGSVIEVDVPEWLHDSTEIKYYMTTIKVPDDRPCASGRTWNETLLQITVPPRPEAFAPPASASEARP